MEHLIPSAESLQRYEKLGIIAILLLVLFIGLGVGAMVFGWVKEFGLKVLDQLTKQTLALENVKQSNASMEVGQARLHARLDENMRCPMRPCPMRPSDNLSQIPR